MKKSYLRAILLLLLLGMIKLPIEQRASARLYASGMLQKQLEIGVMEKLGQSGLSGTLGGFRALMASVIYMQAYVAYENYEWARVDALFQLVCRLQPQDVMYWDEASWHMAYNAASSYLHSPVVEPLMRGKLYHGHIERGEAILLEGLQFNPDDLRLLMRLGDLYARRKLEPQAAGEAYERAADLGAPSFARRLAAYQYLRTTNPESWRKAYTTLMQAYRSGHRPSGVIESLKDLEIKLNVPTEQRIPDELPQRKGAAEPMGPLRQ